MCNVADKVFCIQEHVRQLDELQMLFEKAFGDEKETTFPQLCEECPDGRCIFNEVYTLLWKPLQRLRQRKVNKFVKVTAKSDTEAEILLYDVISDFEDEEWGIINAKGLISKIKALGNIQNITLRINSIGGNVFQAQAMYSYLKSHPANITVHIDGLAASAASVVAMAGNKVIMPSNALIMIHNPAGGVYGEAEDMRDTAEILDKIRDTIANVYIAKTGLEREKVIAMMDSETWLDANEAHELKFCDEVEESLSAVAMVVSDGAIFMGRFGFARADESILSKIPAEIVNNSAKAGGIIPRIPKFLADLQDHGRVSSKDEAISSQNPKKEEKSEMEIKNASELESAYPEFTAEIRNSAITAERERLKTLDSLNAPGREAIIAKAKYEDPKDARDIAIELLQTDTAQAQLQAHHQDAQAVNAALPPEKTVPSAKADEEAAINAVADELNRMRGYK